MRQRSTARFLLYSVIFNMGLLGLLDVVLNFYYVSLGNSPETVGLLQSLPRLAGFLTSVPLGLLTDRLGTRRMLVLATIGASVALWIELIPLLPMLALGRFLYGFAYGAQQIANAPLMVALVEPQKRIQFFALHNLLTMMAMAVGSVIGGFLPALIVNAARGLVPAEWTASATTSFAYGGAILISGAVGLLSVLPILHMHKTTATTPGTAPGVSTGISTRIPWQKLGLAALPMLTFGFSGGLTFPFYNLFWRTQFHLPDQTVGTILSIGWVGMASLPLINRRLERRFGRAGALRLSMIAAASAFFVLGLQPALLISVCVFVVAISCRNMMNPLFQPLMLESLPPNLANVASSMSMVMWNIGWFAATAMGGFVAERYGFGVIMMLVAAAVLVTGFAIPIIFHSRPRIPRSLAWDEPVA